MAPKQPKKKNLKILPQSPKTKKVMSSVDRMMTGKQTHELDNPFKIINIPVAQYWETESIALVFMEQLLSGYVWACKFDHNFIAVHEELGRVERLLAKVIAYKAMLANPDQDPVAYYGERFVSLALIELAMLIPTMWD